MTRARPLAFFFVVSTALLGCAARPSAISAAPRRDTEPRVYRLDFVLTANDGSGTANTTSFTLNLPENDRGEMVIGKNVALVSGHASGPAGAPPMVAPRHDVGMKIAARIRPSGENLLIDVSTEMSTVDSPSDIRKMVSRGSALAFAGKPALVNTLEDDRRRYQLTVTATKLQ